MEHTLKIEYSDNQNLTLKYNTSDENISIQIYNQIIIKNKSFDFDYDEVLAIRNFCNLFFIN